MSERNPAPQWGCKDYTCRAPSSLRLTFSGLSDLIQSGPGSAITISGKSFGDAVYAIPTAPGQLLGSTRAASEGPITAFRLFPYDLTAGDLLAISDTDGFAYLGRKEPSLLAAVNHTGAGANFSVTLSETTDSDGLPVWGVDSATVAGNGAGYIDRSNVDVLFDEKAKCAAKAVIRINATRQQPSLSASVRPTSACLCSAPGETNGNGAEFQINYAQTRFDAGRETWEVSSVTVLNGGQGYRTFQFVDFSLGHGDVANANPVGFITTSNGSIVSVSVLSKGTVYKNGVPSSLSIVSAGEYYEEDSSLPPHVLAPEFTHPSGNPVNAADRATFAVKIDGSTSSSTFGKIESVSLTNGGDKFLAWEQKETCFSSLNNQTIIVRNNAVSAPSAGEENDEGERATVICAEASFGVRPNLAAVIPADYDNLETGIDAVEILAANDNREMAYVNRAQPNITISGGSGSGAVFEPVLRERSDVIPPYWEIASVNMIGGSGYQQFDSLSATTDGVVDRAASLSLRQSRLEPIVTASTPCHAGGATFSVQWEIVPQVNPRAYRISSVAIESPGAGYSGLVPILFAPASGTTQVRAACVIGTAINGEMSSLHIRDPGEYYRVSPNADEVLVLNGGRFYAETSGVTVANVNVYAIQRQPSEGTGAAFLATVDDNPNSATFGKVTSVSVAAAGSDYILRRNSSSYYEQTCGSSEDFPTNFDELHISCSVRFPTNGCSPIVTLTQGGSAGKPSYGGSLVFAADRDGIDYLSSQNRSVTLTPVLPGNSGQVIVEWGGDFDFDERICSCCDLDTERCSDPPDSGFPVEGEASGAYADPLGLVFFGSCDGIDANGNEISDNGGPIQWTAVYDANGDFVSWQLICGQCDEAIEIGVDGNGNPILSNQPEPANVIVSRGGRGQTACLCFPSDSEQFCLWAPEIGEDGCWTGGYLIDSISCQNPLP